MLQTMPLCLLLSLARVQKHDFAFQLPIPLLLTLPSWLWRLPYFANLSVASSGCWHCHNLQSLLVLPPRDGSIQQRLRRTARQPLDRSRSNLPSFLCLLLQHIFCGFQIKSCDCARQARANSSPALHLLTSGRRSNRVEKVVFD